MIVSNQFDYYAPLDQVIKALQAGQVVIVADEENREDESDFIAAAQFTTPEIINFMITHGRGLFCQTLTPKKIQQLNIPPMEYHSKEKADKSNTPPLHGTQFMMSVDSRSCPSSGVSAFDRAMTTTQLLKDGALYHRDFYSPGHCFPLQAAANGLEERLGHTEATIDLMLLADLFPSGVLCEILNQDGSMARLREARQLAGELNLFLTHVYEIRDEIRRRGGREQLIAQSAYKTLY